MADVIRKENEAQLTAPCLLRYFEIAAALQLWIELTNEDSPRLAEIGSIEPGAEDYPAYSRRVALGIYALSRVLP